jgi:hypothetical protein
LQKKQIPSTPNCVLWSWMLSSSLEERKKIHSLRISYITHICKICSKIRKSNLL